MKAVYDQKLYYEDEEDEEPEKKEKKTKKKHKKHHKKQESSEESPREEVSEHKPKEEERKEKVEPKIKPKPQAPQSNLLDFDFDSPTKETTPVTTESSWANFIGPTITEQRTPPTAQSHPETIKKEVPPAVTNSNPFDGIDFNKPVASSPYQNPTNFGNNLPSASVYC